VAIESDSILKGVMDVLKQLDITYNIFIFVQFTPYEQTFQILSKDTFPPIKK
jgi:hypothetical protein